LHIEEERMSRETIGFIGLGLMGHGMAKNIVEKGWPLVVAGHRNRKPIEDLIGRGAVEAANPREVGEKATVVFLCVTGSPEVEAVVRGPDGLKAGLKPGSAIVDCSTSDPVSTAALYEELKAAGIELVDAPLSRTPKEAWEGKLDTMVGASEETFTRLKPLLDAIAGKVVHIGGPGDGHRMKLLNNFLSLGYAAIYAEALALSRKVGISPERFDSVIRGGRMDCGFYQTFSRWTLEGDPDAHKFSIANAYKDLRYLASMANAAGVAGPVTDAVKNSFALAHGAGGDGDFVPMLASHVAHANGIEDGLFEKMPSQADA
jgi:3-hydroxyisobutyrate dehydrogenase-like beta-hydroxyacid dehydrogenase